ncbi:MAG TPA: hypothetical protein VHC48_17375, partial [Puia sp.]|nr:hypothetical protein [Puia sp.]
YTMDAPVNPQAWAEQKSGLHLSFASTGHSWFRTEVPELKETDTWKATGWRGERLNAQLLVWSPDTLEQVRVIAKDFVNAAGKTISHKHITLNLVRYVLSNYPYGAKDAVCGPTPYKNGYLMPDRFEPLEPFQLPGRTVRPIWLSVDVPADAVPGVYKGIATVSTTTTTHSYR